MKKKLISSLAVATTLMNIAGPTFSASAQTTQDVTGDSVNEVPFSITIEDKATGETPGDDSNDTDEIGGDTGEDGENGDGSSEEPIESEYIITIPSGIDSKLDGEELTDVEPGTGGSENETPEEKDTGLAEFEVTAKNVNLPDTQAVQVDVSAKDEYQIDGKNVLLNENETALGYSFVRDESAEYGLADGFDDGDSAGEWTLAQFRHAEHEKFTDRAPVSIKTDDTVVESGKYDSVLEFNIHVVDEGTNESDPTTTPNEGESADSESNTYLQGEPSNEAFFQTWENENGTLDLVTTTDLAQGETEMVIPSHIDGKLVTGILSSFTLPASVTHLEIPGSIKEIPDRTFYRKSIEVLVLNEGLEVIGVSAFYDNKLTDLVIPDSVREIHRGAFYQSKDSMTGRTQTLRTVTLGENTQFVYPDTHTNASFFGPLKNHNGSGRVQLTDVTIKNKELENPEWLMDNLAPSMNNPLTVHVPQGSTMETYVRRQNPRYVTMEYTHTPDFTEEIANKAKYDAMIPTSSDFTVDGVIEVGENALNETNLVMGQYYFGSTASRVNKAMSGTASESSHFGSSDSYIPVKPGEVYYLSYGSQNPSNVTIWATDFTDYSSTAYNVIEKFELNQFKSNGFIYDVPEGVEGIAITISEPLGEHVGAQAFDAYHLIRVK